MTMNSNNGQVPDDVRLPPNDEDAEKALLGSVLIDPDIFPQLTITSKMFYRAHHKHIFNAFERLAQNNIAIDYVTVVESLKKHDINQDAYLVGLTAEVPTATNFRSYEKLVSESYNMRQIISLAGAMATGAYDRETPLDKLISDAFEGLRVVAGDAAEDKVHSAYDLANMILEHLEERRVLPDDEINDHVNTGFKDLDYMLQGIEMGDLLILAARPGMGKTMMAQHIAFHIAYKMLRPVLFISLEMTPKQMVLRFISMLTQIPYKRVANSKQLSKDEWQAVHKAIGIFSQLPIYINSSPKLTPTALDAKVYRFIADHGDVPILYVDYLQLMEADGRFPNREQEVTKISRGLKQIGLEHDTVIFANAQLSRALEQRQIKVPLLSDLRESGSIEQDADTVLFIYRDEYYNPGVSDKPNIAEIYVAKNRNGPVGNIDLFFSAERGKFADLTRKPINL